MKRVIISGFFGVLLLSPVKSQEYIPMAVEGPHWIISYDDIETPVPVDDLWEYYASGDTCIGSNCYKKVYRRDLIVTIDHPPFIPDGPYELFGFIRDDSPGRKVYAMLMDDYGNCSSGGEFLLFDYSIDTGDTVTVCIIPDFIDFVINSITPQHYLGFDTRVFAYIDGDLEYYEGMGSYYGLFEELFAPVKSGDSRYVYHTYLYFYCRESPCDLFVDLPEFADEGKVVVAYPNPFTSSTTIGYELTEPTHVSLTIYNAIGEEVYRAEDRLMPQGKHTFTWSPENLHEGLYYVVLRSDEGVSVVKMVKQ